MGSPSPPPGVEIYLIFVRYGSYFHKFHRGSCLLIRRQGVETPEVLYQEPGGMCMSWSTGIALVRADSSIISILLKYSNIGILSSPAIAHIPHKTILGGEAASLLWAGLLTVEGILAAFGVLK